MMKNDDVFGGKDAETLRKEHMNTINWASTTVEFLSPNKMLVESATMIFIIAFMLFCTVALIWKGGSLSATQMMGSFLGLLFCMTIAVRQYAAFRY